MDKIKILFVGSGEHPMYENAFYNASLKLPNVSSNIFCYGNYILPRTLIKRAEDKLALGPDILKLNKALIYECTQREYDIVFLYTCRLILPNTLKILRKKHVRYIACYCNDNPFSSSFPPYFWRHWRNSIKFCDITYVYRKSNINDCLRYGSRKTEVMLPYFIEDRNFYIPDEDIAINVPDVVFVGHYENDERVKFLKQLANSGIKVGLRDSNEWDEFSENTTNIVRLHNTFTDYNKILNKAKICLVFLSKINKDTYTRRCFEIPTTKTLMLSTYTDDLAKIFKENAEIVFFRNSQDLITKVQYYLSHDLERMKIANACYKKILKEGFSAIDRVKKILENYEKDMHK